MNFTQNKAILYLAITISFFIGAYPFYLIYTRGIPTDILHHANAILESIKIGTFPANFLYFFSVYLFSGFSLEFKYLFRASVVLLTLSVVFKYITSYFIMKQMFFKEKTAMFLEIKITFALLLMLIIHPIITPLDFTNNYFYLGKAAINIWHNSTTIFVMPFVLLLFYYSYLYLQNYKFKYLVLIFGFGLLNIWIKPSFLFSFFIVFPLLLLYKYKLKKPLILAFITLFILGIVLIFEYYLIYIIGNTDDVFYEGQKSSIIIAPFKAMVHSENFFIDILSSIFFPFLFTVFYFKKVKNVLLLNYSWLLFLISLIIGILFVETGPRLFHGNLQWQIPMANYILFLITLAYFIKQIVDNKLRIKDYILILVFIAHLLSGVFHLTNFLLLGNMYL